MHTGVSAMTITSIFDQFIYWTSIAAGVALVLTIYRWIAIVASRSAQKDILGDWFSYAFFDSRGNPAFYRERFTIERERLRPWMLRVTATPDAKGAETIYRGRVWRRGNRIFCMAHEKNYEDQTFEIVEVNMVPEEYGTTAIGIHLGKTFGNKPSAAVIIWSRRSLDQSASDGNYGNLLKEQAVFEEISKSFSKIAPRAFTITMREG